MAATGLLPWVMWHYDRFALEEASFFRDGLSPALRSTRTYAGFPSVAGTHGVSVVSVSTQLLFLWDALVDVKPDLLPRMVVLTELLTYGEECPICPRNIYPPGMRYSKAT